MARKLWNRTALRSWVVLLAWGALLSLGAAAEPVTLTIETAKTGAPISKYVYGQFIEHLGRCIDGGIWAEMLEDRKFYYPVTGDPNPWVPFKNNWSPKSLFPQLVASPWRVVGGTGTVTMTTDKPFVGEHTPQINLPGDDKPHGIAQSGLALVAGKEYVGRVWLAGDPSAAPIRVSLLWERGRGNRQTITIDTLSADYARTELKFTAGASAEDARLVITSRGKGAFRIGAVSLMPADNVQGFRSDTLAVLKELDSPVYRWPGGNFVSGYNWRDGIGDPDRRPPRKNPAWTGVEPNDVGIHEFIGLCRLLKTEPYIAANTGLGTPEQAGEEVQYCNGGTDTPQGQLRARNGHPAPFGVKFWGAGNEMYGGWQLGHMPLEQYVGKHNRVAEVMKAADPKIQLVAVGNVGKWDEMMLAQCADHMDLLSEHFYCKEKSDLGEHVAQLAENIRRKADAHRKYRETIPGLKGKDIRIALDEWNYWYGPHIYGELGTQYFLQDALGVAAAIHEYARQSDMIFMANYAQTVNVIGAIKTDKTHAVLDTTGVILALYRKQYGTLPVSVTGYGAPFDVAAAWTADHKALTISIVNPTPNAAGFKLALGGVRLAKAGTQWTVSGPDAKACNVPGKAPQVVAREAATRLGDGVLKVAPLSATIFRFALAE